MRTITDHVVEGDSVNHQIKISVLDEPGHGGACHKYVADGPIGLDNNMEKCEISFQNGAIKEHGVNGMTHEALLAIVIDRLRGFQSGQFACRENAIALTKGEEMLMWLQRRTRERIRRGVAGTHEK